MEILWVILGILVFAIVMTILVTVHEGGHFLMAKKAGILCHEFAIGMGPVIYQKKKGETVYSIRAFPIGGFVSMAGEEVEDNVLKDVKQVRLVFDKNNKIEKIIVNLENKKYKDLPVYDIVNYDLIGTKEGLEDELYITVLEDGEEVKYIVNRDALVNFEKTLEIQIAPYDRNFVNKPWINRFASVFAGPFMNIVLAVVIFFIIGLVSGYAKTEDTVVGEVNAVENSNNTIEVDDRLTHINGIKLTDWQSISDALAKVDLDKTPQITVGIEGKDDIVINPSAFVYSIEMAFIVDGTSSPIVGHYSASNEQTKAYKAGLRDGDIITKLETEKLILADGVTKQSIINFFNSEELKEGQTIKVTYDRGEQKGLTTEIEVYSEKLLDTQGIPATKLQLGIVCANGFNLGKLLYMPFVQTGESFTMIFKTLGALFSDSSVGVDDLSGPVGIFNLLKNATKEGILTILSWTAILSVNIGFMNLIPLPALDGGRIAFMLYEGITRKKPNAKVENTIHAIGLILLMGLMIFVSFNDVLRCIGCK